MLTFRKKRGVSGSIREEEGYVAKRLPPRRVRRVRAVESEAGRLGASTRRFKVPGILDADEEAGEIRYERIDGFRPLVFALEETPDDGRAREAGVALATIHGALRIPAEAAIDRAGGRPGGYVAVHGDFTVLNVGLDRAGGLVVLDWVPAAAYGTYFNRAERERDLASFLYSLFECASGYGAAWRRFERWAEAFLAGYLSVAGARMDSRLLLRLIAGWGRRSSRWLLGQGKPLGAAVAPVLGWIVSRKTKKVLKHVE